MSYFNPEFLIFFEELSKNNSTVWFNENRKMYENEVKKPFAIFVAEMISRIQKYEPEVQIKPADAISRINKDIRFSKDKTPYNTHVSANISVFGKKDKSYPGFYFQLSPGGISVFGGAYMVDSSTLQRLRGYISNHLTEFAGAYNDELFIEKFETIQGEQNKRIPQEFQDVAINEPLIANKQFYYSASLNVDLITSNELPERLMEYYLAAKPVSEFLQRSFVGN